MPIEELKKNIDKFSDLKEHEVNLIKFEQQRVCKVKQYLSILTDCKDNKLILNLYYEDLYFYISLVQISIIILSTLATFLQALQSDSSISKEFISVFSLCVSTYVSLMLSIFKFLKMDEKKEQVNNLSNKYADIQNKIRYILDTLKPWKDPWYLEIYQIEDKLKEWGEFKGKLANDYITLIENKQNLNTEYEKLLQHKRKKLEQRIKNDNDDSINNMILENPDSDTEEIDTGGVNIRVQEI